MRIGKFAAVGLSGLAVNEILLFLLTDTFGFYFVLSGIIAVETSIITNFLLNERWTFSDRNKKDSVKKRFGKYNAVSLAALAINVTLLFCFTMFFGIYYLVSNILAIIVVFSWNYFVNIRFTWRYDGPEKTFGIGSNPLVSIIVPTYNEAENIAALVAGVFRALDSHKIKGEVVIVDDNSPDGTAEAAEKMKGEYALKIVRRAGKLGLSSAVIEGFKAADGEIIGVMDADLSHPPEAIPDLVRPLLEDKADITIGSRYAAGGSISGWSVKRKVVSKTAGLLAKPLTGVKDPMSGFFFFKRGVMEGKTLNPSGYKIGLEVFVKSGSKKITEIPYVFVDRRKGKSKLGMKENMEYLLHLAKLYWHKINE